MAKYYNPDMSVSDMDGVVKQAKDQQEKDKQTQIDPTIKEIYGEDDEVIEDDKQEESLLKDSMTVINKFNALDGMIFKNYNVAKEFTDGLKNMDISNTLPGDDMTESQVNLNIKPINTINDKILGKINMRRVNFSYLDHTSDSDNPDAPYYYKTEDEAESFFNNYYGVLTGVVFSAVVVTMYVMSRKKN
jgi:hypothetical protein